MALEHHNHKPDIYIDCKVPYTRKVRIFVLYWHRLCTTRLQLLHYIYNHDCTPVLRYRLGQRGQVIAHDFTLSIKVQH
jgi:hypothetical protein